MSERRGKTYVVVEVDGGYVQTIGVYGPADVEVIEIDWDDFWDGGGDRAEINSKISSVNEILVSLGDKTKNTGRTASLVGVLVRLKEALNDLDDDDFSAGDHDNDGPT